MNNIKTGYRYEGGSVTIALLFKTLSIYIYIRSLFIHLNCLICEYQATVPVCYHLFFVSYM